MKNNIKTGTRKYEIHFFTVEINESPWEKARKKKIEENSK